MSRKMGRPKAEKPKDIQYNVRIDIETEARLKIYCEKHKITKAEALRRGIELLLDEK